MRGPYRTGALTPTAAAALVTVPHRHRRASRSCWVTSTATGGRSNTCRACTPTTGAPTNPMADPPVSSLFHEVVWWYFSQRDRFIVYEFQ
jgi:hypothetical protein